MASKRRPIRVVLADDHTLVRAGLRALLEGLEGIEVVGEASDGRQALDITAAERPDVILLDILMPELNGLEAAERIVAEQPRTKILLLSMHANEEYVVRALRTGAAGYLLKGSTIEELERAIHTVAAGGTYLGERIAAMVEGYTDRREAEDLAVADPLADLTRRQREILQLIAEGNNTKEIGAKLGISAKTVETHRAHLMHRLGIYEVAGLVRYAIRRGIISAEE